MATSTQEKPIDTHGGTVPEQVLQRAGFRCLLIGALLIPFNCYWVIRMERVNTGPFPSTVSLFANVVFVLFLMIGINAVLRRFIPRVQLSQAELLTIYTMLAVSTGLAGTDGVQILNQVSVHGAWFATSANGWSRFLGAFPSWLVITNKQMIAAHFIGHASFWQPDVLAAWASPILCWTLFVCLLLLVLQCICVLVRKQWADREKLTFPIIWLPLEMTGTGQGTPFFSNRLMWIGFAIAASLNLWNGVAALEPTLPAVPLGIIDLRTFMTTKPLSAIAWFPITLYPFVIGLGFLLPLDLLFSCVFFFLMWNAQVVVSNQMGWDNMQDFPFVTEQGFGSVIGLFAFYLWSGRRHYKAIWREAWSEKSGSDRSEAIGPRAAFICIGAGLTGMMAFGLLAGVTWWVLALFLGIVVASACVVTRIRAEFGAPVHDFHFMGGDNMIPRAFGTGPLSHSDMTFFTFGYGLTRAHRADTMPIGLEGLQMANRRSFSARLMFGAILLASLLGCLSTMCGYESQAYQLGTASHFDTGDFAATESFTRIEGWVNGTVDPRANIPATIAMGVGFLSTIVLFVLRIRFVGFWLHPIGYAVSSSWAIHLIWFPMLIAWVLKGVSLRYGGLGFYRRAVPLFLGLVLGDCVIGSLWGLFGLVFNVHTYNFFGA